MSPTVFRYRSYRFFFFSREESRVHVHVRSPEGEAKFWLEPKVELADNAGFSRVELREIEWQVRLHEHDILEKWREHFG